ncbi:MAG: aminotransferase class V-fold PLP-dependent enzyme [Candidatus Aminicenantes bacterium]|nr:MAG: aminotransferase class V-fold PLP-dependent enzyme [Candidatus Aminicenantes bacterium]
MSWSLKKDLGRIRNNFPILEKCVYLISHSLGAVPLQVRDDLDRFYTLWADEGVTAWEKEWWLLSEKMGNKVASLLEAEKDSVAMMTNATLCHWVALSTQFSSKRRARNKVVMTDHDFPSVIYAISKVCSFMNWKLEVVRSQGLPGIDVSEIIDRVDEQTLFVATSHVYFKSSYIQDLFQIAQHARNMGALTLIDGYHAPGTIPVDVKTLGVDFYIGGCLKWLCGGPGNAFLYMHPERRKVIEPLLTGWLAHKKPFAFSREMIYTEGAYKLMSGTPPISCLYTAMAGLDIIHKIGKESIRKKSIDQTQMIIENATRREFQVYTPIENEKRGGAVSIGLPHAHQVKQALNKRNVKVDFRQGENDEPDVIRIGPHFYTKDEEIGHLFELIDMILSSGEYKKFGDHSEFVT